jgi:hypothetical protein
MYGFVGESEWRHFDLAIGSELLSCTLTQGLPKAHTIASA